MNTLSITLLTAIAPIIWGTTYFLTTEFLPHNQPFLNAAIRCLPAGIVLLSLFGRKVDRNSLKRLLILSILNISLFQSMLFISAYHLPGGLAALIGSFQPIIILLIAFVLKGDTVSRRNLMFIILSILGIFLTFINNSLEVNTVGVSAAIIGALSMSLGTFLSREWSTKINIYAFTGYQLALGGLALLFISPFFDTYPTNFEARNIYGYLYLIFFGALISYSLWFNGVKKLPISISSSLGFLSPITAIIIGWLTLGQSLSLTQTLGVLLFLFSLYRIILSKQHT